MLVARRAPGRGWWPRSTAAPARAPRPRLLQLVPSARRASGAVLVPRSPRLALPAPPTERLPRSILAFAPGRRRWHGRVRLGWLPRVTAVGSIPKGPTRVSLTDGGATSAALAASGATAASPASAGRATATVD